MNNQEATMNNDKVIEAAKKTGAIEIGYGENHETQYIFTLKELTKFVELLQSQSEPVLQIAIDYSHWIDVDAETYSDINNSIEKRILFTHPPLSVNEQNKADAERYRFLKPMYGMVNFDIYEAENEDDRKAGIIFEMPDGLRYGADLDALIDQAIANKKAGE